MEKSITLRSLRVVSVIALLVAGAYAAADDQAEDLGPFARGFGYVGAFWVTRSSDELRLFSSDLPFGTRLSLQQDLGLDESYAVPRMTVGWRFGKRHILSGSYYDLSRSAVQRVARTIPLPEDNEIEAAIEVRTDFTFRVSKLQYTYLFHRDEKVTLGISAGAYVANLGARLSATAFVGPRQQPEEPFDESITAPLPVLGFRLTYRLTPKWGVLVSSDWFLLSYDDKYKGVLSDTQLYAAHRTFRHVGFAGGINFQTVSVEFQDDDLTWQLDSGLVGILGAVTFYF